MQPIRALIIDDEANARNAIQNMIRQLHLPVEVMEKLLMQQMAWKK